MPESSPRFGSPGISSELFDDLRLRGVQVIPDKHPPVQGVFQQVSQDLHGVAVLVGHIDAPVGTLLELRRLDRLLQLGQGADRAEELAKMN